MYEVIHKFNGKRAVLGRIDTLELAQRIATFVQETTGNYYGVTVRQEVEALAFWRPDDAELALMQAAWRGNGPGSGNKIAAIKFARERSGAGLKEAKDWCDKHCA